MTTIPAPCPLCGAAGPHPVKLRVTHASPFNPGRSASCNAAVVRCPHCGLFRLDPRPDDRSLSSLQRGGLGDAASQVGSVECGNANPDYPPMLSRRLSDAGFPSAGGRLLDVGCGGGDLLDAVATELYAEATGIDVDDTVLRRARDAYPARTWVRASIDDAGIAAGSVDAVTMIHVLEHLADPVGSLVTIRSWLRPGGLLALEVPNGEFYFSRFYSVLLESPKPLLAAALRAAGRRVPFTARGFYPFHLTLFGAESLRATVVQAGYEVLDLVPSTCRLEWWLRENRKSGNWPRYGVNSLKLALARRGLGDNLLVLARRLLR